MITYECKLCGHHSAGATHPHALAAHRAHYRACHHDGSMRLWSALPRRITTA